jgi:hypothetical protein
MSEFVDRVLLQLSTPTELGQLLAPSSDTNRTRLRTLLNAVYDMPFATIHNVLNVQMQTSEFQRPLFPPRRTSGVWTQTTPSYTRTDVAYECSGGLAPVWLDIAAQVGLTLVLEVDAGEVESFLTHEIVGFNTLDEFRARFRFIDLDAFMERHGITTVEELKEAYHYLLAEIRLRTPVPFDPNDPANQYHFTLNIAILIRETIDVAALLRDAKLAQATLECTLIYRQEIDTAEVRTPYAPLVICPEAALGSAPFDRNTLQTFFAGERILALFMTPS